ncbi:hypothetical protein [uncultured Treponema sp.]|uniref:McrB family protein n=1 Tax=uncultured Treponema sp. TaxID=162155 RepID=UPI0025D6423B|nr:hypothetical protein [uncultured Treponema sp.]
MYKNADENFKSASIHMFGIEYAPYIIDNVSPNEIIKVAGIKNSYYAEITKGINIYKCLISGKYDLQYSQLQKNKPTQSVFSTNTNRSFSLESFPQKNSPYAVRYITSLLAKPFAILAGNSGTGKTKIALDFASWFEKKTDSGITNSLIIPVGADWTDNTKILGYFNPLANNENGEYVKSAVLNFIETANANPQIPFFLILDEMNLSHVERYFSDFLSAMESKKPIPLYKKNSGCECSIEESIYLPENLFVTGTVNIDETTYMFSPKVLDRANVIEFSPEKEDILKCFSENIYIKDISPAPGGMAESFVALAEKIRNSEQEPNEELKTNCKNILGELYDILKPSGFEFAYRTAKEIMLYYCAAKNLDSEISTMKILDEQIVQKILPKIHGNKKQIGEMLAKLKAKLSEHEEFILSQAKVQSMIEKLERFQYTSFI